MITAEAHNSTLWLYCDLENIFGVYNNSFISQRKILHLKEFQMQLSMTLYVCVFLLELHYFSLSHTVCEVTQYNCKL